MSGGESSPPSSLSTPLTTLLTIGSDCVMVLADAVVADDDSTLATAACFDSLGRAGDGCCCCCLFVFSLGDFDLLLLLFVVSDLFDLFVCSVGSFTFGSSARLLFSSWSLLLLLFGADVVLLVVVLLAVVVFGVGVVDFLVLSSFK